MYTYIYAVKVPPYLSFDQTISEGNLLREEQLVALHVSRCHGFTDKVSDSVSAEWTEAWLISRLFILLSTINMSILVSFDTYILNNADFNVNSTRRCRTP